VKKQYYSSAQDLQGLENEHGKPAQPADLPWLVERDAMSFLKEVDMDKSGDISAEELEESNEPPTEPHDDL